MRLALALAGGLLLASTSAVAQVGAPISSPVPPGIEAGQSAGFAKGHYADLDALPDWGGIWFHAFQRPAPGDPPPSQPQLKGEYLQLRDAWRADVLANDGIERRERGNCSPPGLPRIMRLPQYPYEFLFTPGRVTINQEAWMQTRTIWTDGRQHPDDVDPSYNGHSIGHWEGDVLVVDTIGISDELEMGEGGRHSDQFRLTERIYLSPGDPDLLINDMRMTDPLALTEPWEVRAQYRRDRHGTLFEFQCSQNDRNPVDEDGLTQFE